MPIGGWVLDRSFVPRGRRERGRPCDRRVGDRSWLGRWGSTRSRRASRPSIRRRCSPTSSAATPRASTLLTCSRRTRRRSCSAPKLRKEGEERSRPPGPAGRRALLSGWSHGAHHLRQRACAPSPAATANATEAAGSRSRRGTGRASAAAGESASPPHGRLGWPPRSRAATSRSTSSAGRSRTSTSGSCARSEVLPQARRQPGERPRALLLRRDRQREDESRDVRGEGGAPRAPLAGDLLGAGFARGISSTYEDRLQDTYLASWTCSATSTSWSWRTSRSPANEWRLEQLYAVVNRRYEDRRPLLVTATWEPERSASTSGSAPARGFWKCEPMPFLDGDHRVRATTPADVRLAG